MPPACLLHNARRRLTKKKPTLLVVRYCRWVILTMVGACGWIGVCVCVCVRARARVRVLWAWVVACQHLDGNGITCKGMAHIAEGLKVNRKLKTLELDYNSVGDVRARNNRHHPHVVVAAVVVAWSSFCRLVVCC